MKNGKRYSSYFFLSASSILFFLIMYVIRFLVINHRNSANISFSLRNKRKPPGTYVSESNGNRRTRPVQPPGLQRFLSGVYLDEKSRNDLQENDKPYVFASSAVCSGEKYGSKLSMSIFLYAYGTYIFDDKRRKVVELDITSCLVGGDRYALSFEAGGMYGCDMKRTINLGDRLSLVVSPKIFRNGTNNQTHALLEREVRKMSLLRDGSYLLWSDLFWDGQIDEIPQRIERRFQTCLMTQEKLFIEYLPEWIEYHRKIGVDHVYLYDNNKQEKLSKMFANKIDVEVIHWPWKKSQIQAQNHFIVHGRRRCKWAVLIDVDEYIMAWGGRKIAAKNALKLYLKSVKEEEGYSQVRLSSISLGSSGYVLPPRLPVAEAYWHIADQQDNLTKPIVWLDHTIPDSHVHRVSLGKGYRTLENSKHHQAISGIEMEVVHMKFRSWSDYVRKGKGGRNSMVVKSWESFSALWSVEKPPIDHLMKRNTDSFTVFRNHWRRVMSRSLKKAELVGHDEKD